MNKAVSRRGFVRGFVRAGVRLVPDCTLLANHALTGRVEKLSVLAERHLGLRLDKAAQKSDAVMTASGA